MLGVADSSAQVPVRKQQGVLSRKRGKHLIVRSEHANQTRERSVGPEPGRARFNSSCCANARWRSWRAFSWQQQPQRVQGIGRTDLEQILGPSARGILPLIARLASHRQRREDRTCAHNFEPQNWQRRPRLQAETLLCKAGKRIHQKKASVRRVYGRTFGRVAKKFLTAWSQVSWQTRLLLRAGQVPRATVP